MDQKLKHTRIIGKIFIVIGTLILVLTSFSFNFVSFAEEYLSLSFSDWQYDFWFFTLNHPPFGLLYLIPTFYLTIALIDIAVGVGLLYQKKWAKMVSVVLAFFMLFSFPLGTAFAIYIFYNVFDAGLLPKEQTTSNS